jgi:hypothetical protein
MKNGLSNSERIDMLREAQEKLLEAIEAIQQADGSAYTENYVIAPLKIIASEGHGYLSHDTNLDDMIRQIESEDEDEDDCEYPDEYAGYDEGNDSDE